MLRIQQHRFIIPHHVLMPFARGSPSMVLNPDFGAPLPQGFEPALTWKGRITSIKNIPAGEGVGYNYGTYNQSRTNWSSFCWICGWTPPPTG